MTRVSGGSAYRSVEACRICGSSELWAFLSLGQTPLANTLVRPLALSSPEPRYPLEVIRCVACGLVQLSVVVDPRILFGSDYAYTTSASAPMVSHFDRYADEIVTKLGLAGQLVVEIGSNDGVLLRPLAQRGARALGVEPATNVARAANAEGLETLNEFFGEDVARRIAAERGPAKAVVANNVLAHIDDLGAVVRSLDALLASDGVFVAEFPYLGDLVEHVEYDTIYHEHLSYFSIGPLQRLFGDAGFAVVDVERQGVHGGSLRIFVARAGRAPSASVRVLADAERRAGLHERAAYERFALRVTESRDSLRGLLAGIRAEGRSVAAIGATAKGNTLLNYCGFTTADIAYIADSTPVKQGMLTPGARIPIRPESALREDHPDFTVLLAWNYTDAITRKFADYVWGGGRFVHPIPLARIMPS